MRQDASSVSIKRVKKRQVLRLELCGVELFMYTKIAGVKGLHYRL